jgi:hypothetical protein
MATTVFDINFNKQEPDSALEVIVFATMYSGDDIQFVGYILLDDNIVQQCQANIILVSGNAQMPLTPFAYLTGVSAGSHNIKFSVQNLENDVPNLTVKAGATIKVTELKRAAR